MRRRRIAAATGGGDRGLASAFFAEATVKAVELRTDVAAGTPSGSGALSEHRAEFGVALAGARIGAESGALALLHQFPPRVYPGSWPATMQPRQQVMARLLDEPLATTAAAARRRRGLAWVLDWLERQPGESWQDRWLASGADAEGNIAWRRLPTAASAGAGRGRTDTEHGRLALARACHC